MLGLESLASCRKGFSVSAHWSLVPLMHMGRTAVCPDNLQAITRKLICTPLWPKSLSFRMVELSCLFVLLDLQGGVLSWLRRLRSLAPGSRKSILQLYS